MWITPAGKVLSGQRLRIIRKSEFGRVSAEATGENYGDLCAPEESLWRETLPDFAGVASQPETPGCCLAPPPSQLHRPAINPVDPVLDVCAREFSGIGEAGGQIADRRLAGAQEGCGAGMGAG